MATENDHAEKRKKRPRKLPKILKDHEIDVLFDVIPNRSFTAQRNRAAFLMMVYGGLRVQEVCSLRPEDFYWAETSKDSTVFVKGKGENERTIGIPRLASEDLKKWMKKRPESEWFFCTHKGNQIHRNYFYAALKRYAKRALKKIPEAAQIQYHGLKIIHPHMLRHTIATKMIRETGNPWIVRRFLGHVDVRTTMIYEHLDSSDVMDAMDRVADGEEMRRKNRKGK